MDGAFEEVEIDVSVNNIGLVTKTSLIILKVNIERLIDQYITEHWKFMDKLLHILHNFSSL